MNDSITELARLVGEALRPINATLVTAESCTGGGIAEAITRIAGSSGWFDRGWVAYSNRAKEEELGVDPALIAASGAVSDAVVIAMADGARRRSAAAWAVAVSGIAGPDGGSADKPVGTVWLAWAGPAGTRAARYEFRGSREEVRSASVAKALEGLLEQIALASR